MEPWPFACREEMLRQVVSSVKRGRNVVIAGAPGVGKTRLAAEVLQSAPAKRGLRAIARATAAAAGIPFGAIAHLLPAANPGEGRNPLHWAADAVTGSQPGTGPLLLWVDDAHLLDSGSAAVVHLLAHTDRARLLVTLRTGATVPDAVTALWKDDLADRMDLPPFDTASVSRLLVAALEGLIAEDTVRRLSEASAGNVLFLRELVMSALEAGTLVNAAGVWRLTGRLPLSHRLADLLDERTGQLDDPTREVLSYVALGEPVGLALLHRLTTPAAVERAEAVGAIVSYVDGGRDMVRLAHPLYGELVRKRSGMLADRRRLAALADMTESVGARRREDALRIAVWRLDSGAAKPDVLTIGCQFAWAAQDYPLARRLGRAAVAGGGGVESAIVLAQVLNDCDRFAEAEELLARFWDERCDPQTAAKLVLARAHALCWGLGQPDAALALLDGVEEDDEIRLMRMRIVGTSQGRWAQAAAIGESILRSPSTPMVAAHARTEQCWLMLYLGRPLDATRLAEEVLADREIWQDRYPQWTGDMLTLIIQASQSIGDLDVFDRAVARAERDVGRSEVFANTVMVNRGIAAVLRGRVATGVRLLREAESYEPSRSRAMAGMSELARALAYLGDVDGATQALGVGQERLFVFRRHKVPFGVRLAVPWIRAASGDVAGAIAECRAAVGFLRDEGAVRRELTALHDAVRLGDAAFAAGRLAEIALSYQGDLAPLYADHARAAADGVGRALDRVAGRFEAMGRLLNAAETFAQAAQAHEAAGRAASARASAGHANVLTSQCEGAMTPALLSLNVPQLTARELEVGRLVAGGLTSAQVAQRLTLSVRTVDNHLGSIYAKLGISRRDQLRQVLGRLPE